MKVQGGDLYRIREQWIPELEGCRRQTVLRAELVGCHPPVEDAHRARGTNEDARSTKSTKDKRSPNWGVI